MAQVTVGGQVHEIPPLSFKSLKRVWPFLQQAANEEDPFANVAAALAVVAEGLATSPTPLTVDEIEDKLLANEIPLLEKTMEGIMEDAGLVKVDGTGAIVKKGSAAGEAPGEATPPSTATSTDTSLNSSQPVAPAETGTS